MRKPKQLTLVKRYQIAILRKAGHNQTQIARHLGVHKSTISRNFAAISANAVTVPSRPRGCGCQAQLFPKPYPATNWIRVELLLREDWSPQQISRWLAQNEGLGVSHESIYKHVKEDKMSGGDLHTHLRCRKKRRETLRDPLSAGTYQKPRLHRSAPRSGG